MSHTSSYNLLADLSLFAKASKISSGLIINYSQPQASRNSVHITMTASHKFLTGQGLYFSNIIHWAIKHNSYLSIKSPPESTDFSFIKTSSKRTFVHIRSQSDSNELFLGNMKEWEETLLTHLTKSNLENDLADWSIWTDNRGYLYFQPTPNILSTWLKMLFEHTAKDQNKEFSSDKTTSDRCLHYIRLRCSQMQKLATIEINPWIEGELNCTNAAELELIYGIIEVYDSLYIGAKYKIVAAGKSLVEKFLEFDRTCRLLDLNPNSPEFHERAGLMAIVRSAVKDLLTNQAIVDPPQF